MKQRLFILLSWLLLLIPSVAFTASAQKTYVVAVGLDHYMYPDIAPDLPCSVNDAKAISHFFHNYNNSSVFMLLNANATRRHILDVLRKEFAKSGPDDEIIFAFVGHGIRGGLTCYETKDEESIISYDEIQDIMKRSKARRKIILAMACYSGGLNITKNRGNTSRRSSYNTSVMVYASSRPDEVSWATTTMKNSFFVNRLLEGFRGEADANRDGKVTVRELFNYVNPKVISDTGGRQHPQMWGKFDDSMVLVYVK